jgi:hypothetical protein
VVGDVEVVLEKYLLACSITGHGAVITYRSSVESRRSVVFIVGVNAPGVLPASPVGGVVLSTGRTTGGDGLPRHVGDDPVRLDGGGQCRLEQHQHGAADRGGLV